MKKALFSLLIAALAAPAFAKDPTLIPIATPDGAPRTVAEGVQMLRAARATRSTSTAPTTQLTRSTRLGRVRPNVIEYETADSAFLIPAAGNLQGNGGTFFRSDLSIGNFNSTTQNIGVGWMVTGQDNTNELLTYFTVPGQSIVAMNDFVGTTLKKSGLGALLVIAFDATGKNTDPNAFIDGFSRIWTPQPGSAGTVSQSFPSVSLFDSNDDFTAFALGLRADSKFRTNVGVVNLDSVAHTWTITSVNNNAKTVTLTVQPFSLGQTGVSTDFADANGNLSLMYDVSGTGFSWSAYASSVDNVTGDGWVSRATQ